MQSPRYYASMLAMTGRIDRFMYQTSSKVIKTFFFRKLQRHNQKKIPKFKTKNWAI